MGAIVKQALGGLEALVAASVDHFVIGCGVSVGVG